MMQNPNEQNLNVLLVDDDALDRKLVTLVLAKNARSIRFKIDGAETMSEALEMVEKDHYDIILLDLNLPDSSGVETVVTLCGRAADVPIVVLTGLDDDEKGLAAIRSGAEDYLVKGESLEYTLVKTIRYAVERKNSKVTLQNAKAELEQINSRLIEASDTARQMADAAQKANISKSEFLANMSHEIRTPMNAIIGFSEVLREEGLSTDQRRYIDLIYDSGKHLLDLINDILDFSKIEAGQMDVEISLCDIVELLGGIESLMGQMAKAKNLEFKVVYKNDIPKIIKTDPHRLRQCLINLVSNAVKFTESGSVVIEVAVTKESENHYIRFDIVDTGIGIAEEKQKTIFESFTQADGSTSRKYGGTGLGLTITKRLVDMLGGKISVESVPDNGATFTMEIAANIDDEVATDNNFDNTKMADIDFAESDEESESFSGTVLIAEDNITNQALVKLMFGKIGLDVVVVEDGKQAIDAAAERHFDLIFLDMQMPVMTGYAAAEEFKARGTDVPIIAMTASTSPQDMGKCEQAGCWDYLAKPIEKRCLIEVLKKYLRTPHTV